jgi:hypothetical protein
MSRKKQIYNAQNLSTHVNVTTKGNSWRQGSSRGFAICRAHRTGHTNSSYKFTGLLHLTGFRLTRKLLYPHLISTNNKLLWPAMYIWNNKIKININVFVHWYEWEPARPNLDYVSATIRKKQTLRTKSSGREGYKNHTLSSCNSHSSSFLEIYTKFCAQGKYYMFNLSWYMLWLIKGRRSMQMHNPHTLHATLKVFRLEWDHLKHWRRSYRVNHNAPGV